MKEDHKKPVFVAVKDGWLVNGKKYPKEKPPEEAAQELAKLIRSLLRDDLHQNRIKIIVAAKGSFHDEMCIFNHDNRQVSHL